MRGVRVLAHPAARQTEGPAHEVKLRDQRNGGWFWAQNELFDVFQPLIGVHGVSVYMTMCRQLGDPKSNGRLSLRDISRASGVSKSEVGRARAAMVVLGMIAEKA